MPSRNKTLKFQNYCKQISLPFVVYADFECFTKPLSTCEPYHYDSYTYSYQKHEPSGFFLYLKGLDGININHSIQLFIQNKMMRRISLQSLFQNLQLLQKRFTKITKRDQNH